MIGFQSLLEAKELVSYMGEKDSKEIWGFFFQWF